MKRIQVVLLLFAIVPMFAITKAIADNNNQPKTSKFVYHGAGNPYLPLWEHLPDGEPRVLKIPTIRENFALTSSVRTMSASAVIADQTSECGRHL